MYIASISYGKDSLAMLGAMQELSIPIDRIVTVDVMATREISADLPEMVDFKAKADEIIFRLTGRKVEHYSNSSYEDIFYRIRKKGKWAGFIYGWNSLFSRWCTSELKQKVLRAVYPHSIHCIGYAFDEPNRYKRLTSRQRAPLVEIGWTEEYCMDWAREHDLLSPVYDNSFRSGCWFCPLQRVDNLRYLRNNYLDLWKIMLEWDSDCQEMAPMCHFKNEKYLSDYEERFKKEV